MSLSFILRVVVLAVTALPGTQTISQNSSHLAPWDRVLRFKAWNCHAPRLGYYLLKPQLTSHLSISPTQTPTPL